MRWLCVLLLAVPAGADLATAVERMKAGELKEALEAARDVAADDKDYARACYVAGEIELALGEPAAAEEAFRAGLAKSAAAEPLLTGLGRALLAQDRTADAAAALEKAVAADAKSARAQAFLGVARLRHSDGKRGRKELDAGLKLAPEDPEVARAAVLEHLRADDTGRAAAVAQKFAKARRDHPMGPFLTALAKEREKEYEEAIEAYEKAIALDDKFLDAHKNLAILCIAQNPVYQNQERTAKAMKHFERYFALGGKDEEVRRIHATLKSFLEGR